VEGIDDVASVQPAGGVGQAVRPEAVVALLFKAKRRAIPPQGELHPQQLCSSVDIGDIEAEKIVPLDHIRVQPVYHTYKSLQDIALRF